MSEQVNRIALSGRICQEPSSRVTTTGKVVAKSRLVHNQWTKKDAPEKPPIFFGIEVWGQEGADALMGAPKGTEVVIEGWLKLDIWTDKEGAKRESLVVSLTNITVVGAQKRAPADPVYPGPMDDTDIPF